MVVKNALQWSGAQRGMMAVNMSGGDTLETLENCAEEHRPAIVKRGFRTAPQNT